MYGDNPIRKADLDNPNSLRVQEIFSTIQGEGPLAGVPAIFIRLAGCNLACHFCDTEFESGIDNVMSVAQIVDQIHELTANSKCRLVVLTGGEPMRQNLSSLIESLLRLSDILQVQIETAGTIWQEDLRSFVERDQLHFVCSPKTPKIQPEVAAICQHFKYIIRASEICPDDGLPIMSTQVLGQKAKLYRPSWLNSSNEENTIWVQPCDETDIEKTKMNEQAAVKSAFTYGYRLSYQIHKALNLP